MVDKQQIETTLRRMRSALSDSLAEASGELESTIAAEIEKIDRKLRRITLAQLNEAAALVADTADDLMGVVRSARTGPFDRILQRIGQGIARMRVDVEAAVDQQTGRIREAPKTEDPETDPTLPAPNPESAPAADPVPTPPGIPNVVKSKDFSQSKAEYMAEWANCKIRDDRRNEVGRAVEKLNTNKTKYAQVAAQFGEMPSHFVGIIHAMEAGFRFDGHLHNGDPLTARTVRVPKGFPKTGNPPFDWEFSAVDALKLEGFDQVRDWSEPHLLYLWEKYNGFGYRFKGLRTPYLWSFSNLYSKGRYVADGVFDENAVSKQCGAAVILKAMLGG